MSAHRLTFISLPVEAMEALLACSVRDASRWAGIELTPFIQAECWLWQIRSEQIRQNPAAADWFAKLALIDGAVIGHGGFHGPPDGRGMVEVGYSVDPPHRRRGHARSILAALLERARHDPAGAVVRATISPANTASLSTIGPFGFAHAGQQWDDNDGLELIFELDVYRASDTAIAAPTSTGPGQGDVPAQCQGPLASSRHHTGGR